MGNMKAVDTSDDVNNANASAGIAGDDANELNSILQKTSKCVVRNPCIFLWIAMILSIGLSLIGLIVGEFSIEVESEGWWSRGTLQANREAQIMLVKAKSTALFYYENQSNSLLYDSVWDDLQMNNQAGYDILASGSDTPSYDEDEEEKNDSSSLVDTLSEDGDEVENEDEDDIELRRRTREKGR